MKKVGPATFVTDGPHMERAIELAYEPIWEGTRGHIEIPTRDWRAETVSGRSAARESAIGGERFRTLQRADELSPRS